MSLPQGADSEVLHLGQELEDENHKIAIVRLEREIQNLKREKEELERDIEELKQVILYVIILSYYYYNYNYLRKRGRPMETLKTMKLNQVNVNKSVQS